MITIVKTLGFQIGSSAAAQGGGEVRGGGREKWSAGGVDVGVDSAKSEVKVERS